MKRAKFLPVLGLLFSLLLACGANTAAPILPTTPLAIVSTAGQSSSTASATLSNGNINLTFLCSDATNTVKVAMCLTACCK